MDAHRLDARRGLDSTHKSSAHGSSACENSPCLQKQSLPPRTVPTTSIIRAALFRLGKTSAMRTGLEPHKSRTAQVSKCTSLKLHGPRIMSRRALSYPLLGMVQSLSGSSSWDSPSWDSFSRDSRDGLFRGPFSPSGPAVEEPGTSLSASLLLWTDCPHSRHRACL